jgi:hypothetical protein
MNKALNRLAEFLGENCSPDQLIGALYAIRAPYCLTAIIPAARQFRDWRRKYPALSELPELPPYPRCLDVLDRIADLDVDDDELTGRNLAAHRDQRTPLRPYSGDSCICELLLVRADPGADATDFERASVWLLWHLQRFHLKDLTETDYRRYLAGEIPRLNRFRYGGRLYRAWLALRLLGRSDHAARSALKAVAHLADKLTSDRSKQVAAKLGGSDGPLYAEELAKLLASLNAPAPTAGGQVASATDRPREQLNALATLLASLWDKCLAPPVRRHGWLTGPRSGGDLDRPQLRRGERLTEMLQRVNGDDLHAGTVIEFFVPDPPPRGRAGAADDDDDDPEEEEAGRPEVAVFLADTESLIKGFYASRGLRNAIEYQNALLRWNKSTLSRIAVHAVHDLVVGNGIRSANLTSLDRAARLAIGLSLITGRSLADVAKPIISKGVPAVDDRVPIGIGTAEQRVYVRAGHPSLKHKAVTLPPFCRPIAAALSLPLPDAWRGLVDSVGRPRSQRKIAKRARALLRDLANAHPALRITEAGICDALIGILAERSSGDLGLLTAVTGGADANGRNIIHYASYPAAQVESFWREAAESLIGPLSRDRVEPSSAVRVPSPAHYVGAQHAFDLEKLGQYFVRIRERFQAASAGGDWLRAYNLLTLYLSYWLGLGLAQRKTLTPVPRILVEDGWVLVADKHRDDGSTDRLVPMTPKLRAQVDAWTAFAEELSIAVPSLDPIIATGQGCEIRMQYLRKDKRGGEVRVVRYQPRYQELDRQLTALPANWGRKVVRSESGQLPGRYRDAELGHFVRGRHAWDSTSTLHAQDFRERWLALQSGLEEQLGLEILAVGNALKPRRALLRRPGTGHAERRKQASVPEELPDLEVERWLSDVDEAALEALKNAAAAAKPPVALDLVRALIHTHKHEAVERQRQVAEAACNWARKTYKIPIFVAERRALPGNQVMLSADDLQTLAYLEREVFTAFGQDLECLPPRKPSAGREGLVEQQVELGRLVMLGIWRLGLASWPVLSSWLRALQRDRPILAQGQNRYMVFRVKGRQARDSTVRTVFLDDFTSAYLTACSADLQEELLPYIFRRGAPRARIRVQTALQAYLRHIGAGREKVSLTAMLGAATQSIMLRSAPVVAAYAAGILATDDLGDAQLRRLGGLEPLRKRAVPEDQESSDTPALGVFELPAQLLSQVPILRAIGRHSSASPSEWRRLIRTYQPKSALERLLCSYALWLVDYSDTRAPKPKFSTRRKDQLADRIKVIAYAFLGYTEDEPNQVLDGDALAALREASQDQFPDRLQHGAWYLFDQFLRDKKADHAGFVIGKLGPKLDRSVSAKILSAAELTKLQSQLASARSRIGNPLLRHSAQRHVELMATFGMRRAESAYLRALDYQVDACRVQAYGEHTLKTAWADRVLPMAFAQPEMRAWIDGAKQQGFEKLIDPRADEPAAPDNFFDALSRLIKNVTGDQSMGSHHLRHTLASRMVLTLLRGPSNLDGLFEELPWLEELLIDPARMHALLGQEGDAGQGLRALAALVGHSHPTTTLRHYVHVLGIALYGALRKGDALDMSRSFEHRIGGKSTVQRWATQLRAEFADAGEIEQQRRRLNRALRNRIERRFQWAGIDRDETQRTVADIQPQDLVVNPSADAIVFDRLELVDRSLRDARLLLDGQEIAMYREGLLWLKTIGSGKRGGSVSRHVLEQIRDDVCLPARLPAGTATEAAVSLCIWLESMRTERPEDFDWLLEKWAYASERERGRMRLDSQREVDRARALAESRQVKVEVHGATVAKKRQASARSVPRMRIKCLDARGHTIVRDTATVRWVLSYVAARSHGHGADVDGRPTPDQPPPT